MFPNVVTYGKSLKSLGRSLPYRDLSIRAQVINLLMELQRNGNVSDATYGRALAKFGEAGIVETTSLAGYYAMLAMVMNTARTPLAEGVKPALAPLPR